MLRAHRRIGLAVAVCVFGLQTSTRAQYQYPCEGCLPNQAPASPAPANPAPANPAPATPEEPVAAAPSPVMFAAPAPSGEIAGARRSIGLPSLHISLPKISLETPEVRIRGWTKFRRDAQMHLDEGTAPAAAGPPALFGQLVGAQLQGARASAAPANAAPANPAPASAAPAEPAGVPCALQQQSEEVRQLSMQVQQLQGLLLQVAEQQAAARSLSQPQAEPEQPVYNEIPEDQPSVGMNVRRSAPPAGRRPAERDLAAIQRQRLLEENYQRKCEELEALQARMEQIEQQHQVLLEKSLENMVSEREARLRKQIDRNEADVVQSSYEDVESPMSAAPRKMPPRPAAVRRVPTASDADTFSNQSDEMRWKRP